LAECDVAEHNPLDKYKFPGVEVEKGDKATRSIPFRSLHRFAILVDIMSPFPVINDIRCAFGD
jgi:hypothetical protein